MKTKLKDRLGDVVLILVFLATVSACARYIFIVMTTWSVKGLGW